MSDDLMRDERTQPVMPVKPVRLSRWLMIIGLGLLNHALGAQQLQVAARVVGVEPIYAAARTHCDVPPPRAADGLAATLQWDLAGRCREQPAGTEPIRWRVQYKWDNRTFSTETRRKPGDTLPIVVTLN